MPSPTIVAEPHGYWLPPQEVMRIRQATAAVSVPKPSQSTGLLTVWRGRCSRVATTISARIPTGRFT